MTDAPVQDVKGASVEAAERRRVMLAGRAKARHAAERRFGWFSLAMVAIAALSCVVLLGSIMLQSRNALTEHRLDLTVQVTPAKADPVGTRDPATIRQEGDFYGLVQDELLRRFPGAEANGTMFDLFEMAAPVAAVPLARQIAADPSVIGKSLAVSIPLNDDVSLFFKGAMGAVTEVPGAGALSAAPQPDGTWVLQAGDTGFASAARQLRAGVEAGLGDQQAGIDEGRKELASLEADIAGLRAVASPTEAQEAALEEAETRLLTRSAEVDAAIAALASSRAALAGDGGFDLGPTKPTMLVEAGNTTWHVRSVSADRLTALPVAVEGTTPDLAAATGAWTMVYVGSAEDARPVNDTQIAYARRLMADGAISEGLNSTIVTSSDSNEPELAGLAAAFLGSILTLIVTAMCAIPLGVAAAIYLEEFAPKNRWTDLIEVNINNLAAVPSIVFGLLGFAVFLTFFGMPRSAPLVGGLVLALMSLPIVIIASRAALKAVPPSVRDAALAVGASRMQAVFHHVVPAAIPGIMTGSILAMAHALGETAPLLMIGMVAFIADVPSSLTDSATVLPVEIYMWASRPERAWDPRSALAILGLLLFMMIMNAVAIWLRRRFEQRW